MKYLKYLFQDSLKVFNLKNEIILDNDQFYDLVCWKNRKKFFGCLESFLEKGFNFYEFDVQFFKIWQSCTDLDISLKENIQINSNCYGFSTILFEIVTQLDLHDTDTISEGDLKDWVKEQYKLLLEYEYQFYLSEALINRSFNILKAVSLIFLSLLVIPY